jgi:hypothetical protein
MQYYRRCTLMVCITIIFLSGCAIHNVKYVALCKFKIEPTNGAVAINGSIDQVKPIIEQANLPHNTARQKLDLMLKAGDLLLFQLGSQNYILLGEVYGGGNAYTNIETLKAELCKTAANKGGDVVLIFNAGIQEKPYIYTTPAYTTTNVYGSAYQSGNYAYGNATGYTTHMPSQTYSGVLRFPYANGLVFKYEPSAKERRIALSALDDDTLSTVLPKLQSMGMDKTLTYNEYLHKCDELISTHKKP